MAYAITLRLDPTTEIAVRAVWLGLANGGMSEDMLQLGFAPHLSLAVLDDEPPAAPAEVLLDSKTITCLLGGVRRFHGTDVVWLAVDGGEALAGLHRRVLAHLPFDRVWPNYRVERWVPHVALQTTGDSARAMTLATPMWPEPRRAQFVAMDLVQFPPVTVLASRALVG